MPKLASSSGLTRKVGRSSGARRYSVSVRVRRHGVYYDVTAAAKSIPYAHGMVSYIRPKPELPLAAFRTTVRSIARLPHSPHLKGIRLKLAVVTCEHPLQLTGHHSASERRPPPIIRALSYPHAKQCASVDDPIIDLPGVTAVGNLVRQRAFTARLICFALIHINPYNAIR